MTAFCSLDSFFGLPVHKKSSAARLYLHFPSRTKGSIFLPCYTCGSLPYFSFQRYRLEKKEKKNTLSNILWFLHKADLVIF